MSKAWVNSLRLIALINVALAVQTWRNSRLLREPDRTGLTPASAELISVLVPARNEAKNIDELMRCLMAQNESLDLEILMETIKCCGRWLSCQLLEAQHQVYTLIQFRESNTFSNFKLV